MAGATSKPANPGKVGKIVEAETASLKRARDGSAFTRCEACNKDVPVALIDMHSCSLDSKIKMNLEAQVVEKATELKKPSERKRTAASKPREKRGKKEKKSKDPNAPKRPPTAFFLFMDDFRKEFKEKNPESKKVSASAKEGGEKWKSMSDEEKKRYFDKAAELKAEYVKATEKHEVDDNDDETTEQANEADDETTEEANEADENKTSVQVHEDEGSQKEED